MTRDLRLVVTSDEVSLLTCHLSLVTHHLSRFHWRIYRDAELHHKGELFVEYRKLGKNRHQCFCHRVGLLAFRRWPILGRPG